MKFKIVFNEMTNQIVVNCRPNNTEREVVLPDNPDQHVYYPLPDLPAPVQETLQEDLESLTTEEDTQEFLDIKDEIGALQTRRRALMTSLRERLNPQIIERCRDFKMKFPELFI